MAAIRGRDSSPSSAGGDKFAEHVDEVLRHPHPLLEQSIVRAMGSGNEDYVLSPRFTLRCQGYFARRHTTVRSQRAASSPENAPLGAIIVQGVNIYGIK